VYFLNADATRLVMTTADAPGQPSASIALELLTLGPTVADSKHHFRTALSTSPQATPAVRVDPRSGLATVALDNTTEALFGPPLYEALAQIVFTITDAGFGVHSVVFTYAGGRIYAYLPNLTYTERPVTRADFAELAPAASSTTPKATAASTSTTSSAPASP